MKRVGIPRRLLDRAFLRALSPVLRPLGYAIVPTDAARPCAWGARRIRDSFPPLSTWCQVGDRHQYFIHEGYQHRSHASYFDDTSSTDQSQLEVYQFAREVCDSNSLKSVVDVGCGSGYKLIKFLGHLDTIGLDVPKTCEWLRRKYPRHTWREASSFSTPEEGVDLVIASDVIEHVENPDQLMTLIASMRPKYIVLSTPDRNLLRVGTHNGPPLNPTHLREWNFAEFEAYVGHYFEIQEHFLSSAPQATQCILCRSNVPEKLAERTSK